MEKRKSNHQHIKTNLTRKIHANELLWLLLVLYAMFAFTRIKMFGSMEVNGILTNNIVFIALLVILIKILFIDDTLMNIKISYGGVIAFSILLAAIIVDLRFLNNVDHFVLSILYCFVPILFLAFFKQSDEKTDKFVLHSIVVITIIYGILTIIASTQSAYLLNFIGTASTVSAGEQTRGHLMLGSSIAVSYYFNFVLPLCVLGLMREKKEKWKIATLMALCLDVAATIVMLSRAANFAMIVEILLLIILLKKKD